MKIATAILNIIIAASIAATPILAVAACDITKLVGYPKNPDPLQPGKFLETYDDISQCTYSTAIDQCQGSCKIVD